MQATPFVLKKLTHSVCQAVEPAGDLFRNQVLEILKMAPTAVLHSGHDRQPGGASLSGVR
jgi:hypothetical protein